MRRPVPAMAKAISTRSRMTATSSVAEEYAGV